MVGIDATTSQASWILNTGYNNRFMQNSIKFRQKLEMEFLIGIICGLGSGRRWEGKKKKKERKSKNLQSVDWCKWVVGMIRGVERGTGDGAGGNKEEECNGHLASNGRPKAQALH